MAAVEPAYIGNGGACDDLDPSGDWGDDVVAWAESLAAWPMASPVCWAASLVPEEHPVRVRAVAAIKAVPAPSNLRACMERTLQSADAT
jgi:hypothetical protein